MCGRFVSATPPDDLARYFGAAPEAHLEANFNVAPTAEVFVVVSDGSLRHLDAFRWGLVPHWAKDPSVGNKMINARAETVATKSAFRRALAKRRCIIPADGFYEWTTVPGQKTRQPWYIHRPDGEPYAFAGLWEVWRPAPAVGPTTGTGDGDAGGSTEGAGAVPVLRSCTIITGAANAKMAELHDRMPIVLPPTVWDDWLDPANGDLDRLGKLLVPAPPELVAFHAVSTEVNNARNRGAHLLEPVAVGPSAGQQLALGGAAPGGPDAGPQDGGEPGGGRRGRRPRGDKPSDGRGSPA